MVHLYGPPSFSIQFPVDCPLLGYDSCSIPDTPSESPDLSIENGIILLPFNTNVLDKGIPLALTEQSSEVSSNDTRVILVKSVHLSSQVVNYQLFVSSCSVGCTSCRLICMCVDALTCVFLPTASILMCINSMQVQGMNWI